MRTILLSSFFFTAFLLLSACGKGLNTNQIQDRLIGTWEIDRVEFKDKGTIGRKDVSSNWINYETTFFNDGTLEWIDRSTQDTLLGYWYVDQTINWDPNSQSNEVVQLLELYVYDNFSANYRYMKWEEIGITSSTLRAQELKDQGRYYFKWKNID
jgi:hypothetical protein